MDNGTVLVALWVMFLLYWYFSATKQKAVKERQPPVAEWSWRAPVLAAAALLIFTPLPAPDARFLPAGPVWPAVGIVITAAGLAFAVWARRTIGGNWGSAVSLKEGHELVQEGPYRYVRNPIYTGMIAMVLGTALVLGRRSAVLALVLMTGGFWLKAKQEEALMQRQFPDAYAAYRQRVKALIPFVW